MPLDSFPLVVDLDGTLIKGDSLQESLAFAIKKDWRNLFLIVRRVFQGRLALKEFGGNFAESVFGSIPENMHVVKLVSAARSSGRQVFLATASREEVARLAERRFGPFEESFASSESVNLKGPRKAEELVKRFGEKGFDYIGDAGADHSVFEVARESFLIRNDLPTGVVSADRGRQQMSRRLRHETSAVLSAIRPYQWAKNLLLFVPALAAGAIDTDSYVKLVVGFAAFSSVASGLYIFNDLLDVWDDRTHPHKRKRPFASGDLSFVGGVGLGLILVVLGLAVALALDGGFFLVLVVYAAVSAAYSSYLKRKVLVDAFVLAGLYLSRLVAGSVIADINLSGWLLVFSMFVFLSLALAKRFVELESAPKTELGAIRGRGYHRDDKSFVARAGESLAVVSGAMLALYVANETQTDSEFVSVTMLWLIVPVWLFWILRVWILAERKELHSDPILFAIRDKLSVALGLLMAVLFLV